MDYFTGQNELIFTQETFDKMLENMRFQESCRILPQPQSDRVREKVDVLKMLKDPNSVTKIVGPMVRYSKSSFRDTCAHFDCDIIYTPMMLAREFIRNDLARISEFTTNLDNIRGKGLIVQLGVNNSIDLIRTIELLKDYCDAFGINSGCPIKQQNDEMIGAQLIYNPDGLCEMVSAVKKKYRDEVKLEVKIRIHDNWNQTVELCQRLHSAGADWISIHGRGKNTRSSQPCNFEAIKYIRNHLPETFPVVANGDCFSLADVKTIAQKCNVQGVMAVRGVLNNPAMFSGYDYTPWKAIELIVHYSVEYGLHFALLQHHLHCMLSNSSPKPNSKTLKKLMDNEIKSTFDIIDYLDTHFKLKRYGEEGFATAEEVPYL
ncbi:hypothetical protein QEN19_002689 [Hanseniaspora menglaensis]